MPVPCHAEVYDLSCDSCHFIGVSQNLEQETKTFSLRKGSFLSKNYFPFDKDQGAVRVRDELVPIAEHSVPPKMKMGELVCRLAWESVFGEPI